MKRVPGWMQRAVALGHDAFLKTAPVEHIPVAGYHDARTLIASDGSLMQTIEFDGVPFDTASDEELQNWKQNRALVLKQIADPSISLTWHAVRRHETRKPGGSFEPGWARDLDARYMARWAGRRFYSNTFYLTVTKAAPVTQASLLHKLGLQRSAVSDAARQRSLDSLTTTVENIRSSFARYRPTLLELADTGGDGALRAEHLSLFGWLVNAEWRLQCAPRSDFSSALSWAPIAFNGDTVRILRPDGSPVYGAMLGLKEYPPSTFPGMLDGLLELDTELTVTQTYRFAGRDAAIEEARRQQRRYELMGDAAVSLSTELVDMTDDLASRRLEWGQHHFSVLLLATTRDDLKDRVNQAVTLVNATGASAVRETLNLEPAYWAQLPGNQGYIARSGGISSRNLASLNSMHDFDAGKLDGNRWGTALTALETMAKTPYWFSFHTGDVGHTIVIGTTGSGKTVAMSFMLAQAQRYPQKPRIFVIDKDRSTEIALRALGGKYTTVKAGTTTGWNPFQIDDTAPNRAWLKEFLALLAAPEGKLHPAVRASIEFAINDLLTVPLYLRTAEGCLGYINLGPEHNDAKANLTEWLHPAGSRAWVFGAATNTFSVSDPIAGIDLTAALNIPGVAEATMSWLFHQIGQAVDGYPTIVYVEEAWSYMRNPMFSDKVEDWLRTWRKKNAMVIFVTQGAGDALNGRIGRAIVEQAKTKIIFPSAMFSRDQYVTEWNLTEHQYTLLRELGSDSRAFLVRRDDTATILRLDLSGFPDDLAILSGTAERLEVLDAIRGRVGDDPQDWLPLYLESLK